MKLPEKKTLNAANYTALPCPEDSSPLGYTAVSKVANSVRNIPNIPTVPGVQGVWKVPEVQIPLILLRFPNIPNVQSAQNGLNIPIMFESLQIHVPGTRAPLPSPPPYSIRDPRSVEGGGVGSE